MLEWFIEPSNRYHIYLDIKDTQGYRKVIKLFDPKLSKQLFPFTEAADLQ